MEMGGKARAAAKFDVRGNLDGLDVLDLAERGKEIYLALTNTGIDMNMTISR
jgi:hypothetical protein